MTKLTKPQRARLEKLATYLEGLPEDYAHFNMRQFFGLNSDSPETLRYARKNGGVDACGTVACAVGHGPAAGILVAPRFRQRGRVSWGPYSEQFVPDMNESDGAWDWCFVGHWSEYDDHHYGAAARIRYLLDHGTPPPDFAEENVGEWALPLYAPYRIDAKAKADA